MRGLSGKYTGIVKTRGFCPTYDPPYAMVCQLHSPAVGGTERLPIGTIVEKTDHIVEIKPKWPVIVLSVGKGVEVPPPKHVYTLCSRPGDCKPVMPKRGWVGVNAFLQRRPLSLSAVSRRSHNWWAN